MKEGIGMKQNFKDMETSDDKLSAISSSSQSSLMEPQNVDEEDEP